jgi:enolase
VQDDWGNYAPFTAAVGKDIQVVGDDLLVTNPKRIKEAASKKACNALLLKVGTSLTLITSGSKHCH